MVRRASGKVDIPLVSCYDSSGSKDMAYDDFSKSDSCGY